jgi:hypothetical protein
MVALLHGSSETTNSPKRANDGGTSFPAAKETPFFDVRVGS